MRRPLPRLAAVLLAVLAATAGACSADGEVGGPDIGGAAAASIGSFQYSSSELEDEVEAWVANPAFLQQVLQIEDLGRPGRRSAQLVSFVLSHRVLTEQGRQLAEGGFEPSDAEIDQLLAQIDGAFPDPTTGEPLFQQYSRDFRRQLGEDFAFQQNLSTVDPTAADVPEVEVNPRYGTFVDQDRGLGEVVAPTGPAPAPFPGQ